MIPKFRFMIFFLVVLTVTILVNLYIYFRTRPLFPTGNPGWWLAFTLFWIIALSYILGRFSERAGLNWLAIPLIKAGSWWLGAMVYLTLIFLLADIFRGISLIPGLKGFFSFPWLSEKGKIVSLSVYAITIVILVAGYINALYPAVIKQSVKMNKPLPEGTFKAVLASDIHLGMMISNGRLSRLVNMINRQEADVILLGGDIFDEDLGSVIRNNLGDLLKNLKARDGAYAILGNHEFFGNADEAQKYLENHNIKVLRDSTFVLPNGISLVGREDISGQQMFRKVRKSLQELLSEVDTLKPVIVMDHQPFKLKEVATHPVDLQLSGHTHDGQMWPFNYIIEAMYEIGTGYGKINNTQFYVSPGVGTWGPPIRTTCRPEVIVLEITGSK
jgi:predicted MPP superfamily phosphohydrolase